MGKEDQEKWTSRMPMRKPMSVVLAEPQNDTLSDAGLKMTFWMNSTYLSSALVAARQ